MPAPDGSADSAAANRAGTSENAPSVSGGAVPVRIPLPASLLDNGDGGGSGVAGIERVNREGDTLGMTGVP
jgi:hypothetical protein